MNKDKDQPVDELKQPYTIAILFNTVDGRTDMTLLTECADAPDTYSMRLHGISLSENKTQLLYKDHEALQAFCKSYIEHSGYEVR